MKAHEYISRLDDARHGHRMTEDKAPIAAAPSHAPTSTAPWKTPSSGKSSDGGARTGGEKDAIKKADHAIPAPIEKSPSHAPTSTAQWKTDSSVKSDDEGEKVSKEAMKEALASLIDGDTSEIEALLSEETFAEGGHKTGCKCGFCLNKGKFGKKKDGEKDDGEKDDEEKMHEAITGYGPGPVRAPMIKRRLGGQRMGFHHPVQPRAKAAINPYQPAMERLDTASRVDQAIQEIADDLLEAPEF